MNSTRDFNAARARLSAATRDALDDRAKFLRALKVFQKQPPKLVPYVQTSEQQRVDQWISETRRGLLLKARQVGGTTAVRGFAFHEVYALGRPARWATISYKQASSLEIGRTDSQFLDSLPAPLTKALHGQPRVIQGEIEFPRTGGRLIAYTASATGGTGTRSFALTDGHISELAFYPDPAELLATVEGSVGEGRLIAESTANAPGDYFHRMCLGALDGSNGWSLCTSWWWQNPDYATPVPLLDAFEPTDEEVVMATLYGLSPEQILWRRAKVKLMGEDKFKREFPACFDDAFNRGSGGEFEPHLFETVSDRWDGAQPEANDIYVLGADPSGGQGGGDDAAYTVRSVSTGRVVAHEASDRWPPETFARIIADVALKYNKALIIVEENNHGHAVLLALRHIGYTNLYYDPDTKTGNFGTSGKSKTLAMSYVRELLEAQGIASLPLALLTQLRALRKGEGAKTARAPTGEKDDRAMSFVLSEVALRAVPVYVNVREVQRPRLEAILSRSRAAKYKGRVGAWTSR